MQFLGFAQMMQTQFTYSEAFTSKLLTFGVFGGGVVCSMLLVFAMLTDIICSY